MDYTLHQRGRASLQFLSSLGEVMPSVSMQSAEALKQAGVTADSLPEDIDERYEHVLPVLKQTKSFRLQNTMGEWWAEQHGAMALEAFEEMRDEIAPVLDALNEGPSTLDPNPDQPQPAYWTDHVIHRSKGGWDGHDYMGFVHGELIHTMLVAKAYGGRMDEQRDQVINELDTSRIKTILDIGAGSGQMTRRLSLALPDAEIHAIDVGLRPLEQAMRRSNELGQKVHYKRVMSEDTGYEDNAFDAVISYAQIHENPLHVIVDTFKEVMRVLKPGGEVIFSDVLPYHEQDKLGVWRADYQAKFGGEPFWRESAGFDLVSAMKEIGFEDAKCYGLSEAKYPYVHYGRKPA